MGAGRWLEGFPRSLLIEAFRLWSSGRIHWRPGNGDTLLATVSPISKSPAGVSREMKWRRPRSGGEIRLEALRERGCGCRSSKPCAHEVAAWLALLFDIGPAPDEGLEDLRRLEAQLEQRTATELLRLARLRGWPLPRGRKPELTRRLAARLFLYFRLGLWREELDPELEGLLSLIRLLGIERVDLEDLETRWIRWTGGERRAFRQIWDRALRKGLLIPCGLSHEARPRPHAHLAAALEISTLPAPVFPITIYRGFPPDRIVAAPPLAPLLREVRRGLLPQRIGIALRAHPRASLFPWLWGWPHDPEEVDALLARHPWGPPPYEWITVPVSWLASGAVEAVMDRIGLPWEGAAFLVEAVWRLSGAPLGESFPAPPALWEADDEELMDRLWELWRSGATLFEILWLQRRDPTVRLLRSIGWAGGMEQLYYEWGLGRQVLIRLLEGLPDEWVDWTDVVRALEAAQPPGFAGPAIDRPWRLVRGRPVQEPLHLAEHVRAYLEGTLFWLGAVALAYEGDAWRAFRLTPRGRRWIRGESGKGVSAIERALDQMSLPQTRWLDERTWSVRPGPDSARLLALSSRLGRPTGSPFVFTLDEERMEKVLREGYRPEEILELFETSGLSPTLSLRQVLQEAWARLSRVQVFENVTILETGDPLILRELLAATSLESAILGWLAPNLVIIEESALERLQKEMRERGYYPIVVRG